MNTIDPGPPARLEAATAPASRPDSRIPDRFFVFELANNHMGDVEHGLRVIDALAAVARKHRFNFAVKMQYRELDSFIHPEFKGRMDVKYIKRFSETRLSAKDNRRLVDAVVTSGFTPMCTAFDEPSVDRLVDDGFAIVKIGSCSLTDWPLLEKIGTTGLPIIASTAGATVQEIDNVVLYLQNRKKDFALMHCVGLYPTPTDRLALNRIDLLRRSYPGVPIGYSTHEDPAETLPVAIAIAKGCSIFEKHVGIATDKYPLNAYSASPAQIDAWLQVAEKAYAVAGPSGSDFAPSQAERESLFSLQRGVFAARDIAAGERLKTADVFMAIPTRSGQVTANEWSKYNQFYSLVPIAKGEALLATNTRRENVRSNVLSIVQRIRAMLDEANIVVPSAAEVEISHHYGLQRFDEFGIAMITVVNREYCKKLIVILPGQKHPEQHHKKKEETFLVLHGKLTLTLDGVERPCKRGDVVTIERGTKHAFESRDGAIVEEISSTHEPGDSYYSDPAINANRERKTVLTYWLR